MRRNFANSVLVLSLLLFGQSLAAQTAKFVLSAGAFQFSAENASNKLSRSISGMGSYQVSYRHAVKQVFEIDLGYSMLATETIGGDVSFGFDIGANYYPLTDATGLVGDSDLAIIRLNDRWRPFVGLSFSQRNFQSTNSQYAGLGIKGGTEFQFNEQFAIHGTVRYLMLGGPNQSFATQIDILSGIVVQY